MIWVSVLTALSLLFLFKGRKPTGIGLKRLSRITGSEDRTDRKRSLDVRRAFHGLVTLPGRFLPERTLERLSRDLGKRAPLSGMEMPEMVGIRFWSTILFPAVTAMAFRFSPISLFLALPAALLGYFLPVLTANRNRRKYIDEVRRCLPDTTDMLYAFVLGGRNLDQAFTGAAETAPEPLRALLGRAVREMELGASRQETFEELKRRCPVPELASVLNLLLEAERRGYSLSGALKILSSEIRAKRRDQLRAAVAKAPLKMLAPLVFLILPASVILVVGPTLFAALQRSF